MGLRQVLGRIGQAESGQRRANHLGRRIKDELAFDMHLQLAFTFFEIPGVQPATGVWENPDTFARSPDGIRSKPSVELEIRPAPVSAPSSSARL